MFRFSNKEAEIMTLALFVDFYCNFLESRYFYTANIYLLKVNNRNTRKKYKIRSKLTIKTSERRQQHPPGIFIVNLEQNHVHLFLVLLSTLIICLFARYFENVFVCCLDIPALLNLCFYYCFRYVFEISLLFQRKQ